MSAQNSFAVGGKHIQTTPPFRIRRQMKKRGLKAIVLHPYEHVRDKHGLPIILENSELEDLVVEEPRGLPLARYNPWWTPMLDFYIRDRDLAYDLYKHARDAYMVEVASQKWRRLFLNFYEYKDWRGLYKNTERVADSQVQNAGDLFQLMILAKYDYQYRERQLAKMRESGKFTVYRL